MRAVPERRLSLAPLR